MSRPWGPADGLQAPPGGMDVEVLAITMAAALGLAWNALDADNALRLRVCANAALIRLGANGQAQGAARLRDAVTEAADCLRLGAQLADHHKAAEPIIQRLHRAAASIETVGAALGVIAQYEPVGDDEAV